MYSEAIYRVKAVALAVLTFSSLNLLADEKVANPQWSQRKAQWLNSEIRCMDKALAGFKAEKVEGTDTSEGCYDRAVALYDYVAKECPTTARKVYFTWIQGDLMLSKADQKKRPDPNGGGKFIDPKDEVWRYHTAVAYTDNTEYVWVLDPTINTEAMWHKKWVERFNPSKGKIRHDTTDPKTLSILGSPDSYPTDPKPLKVGSYLQRSLAPLAQGSRAHGYYADSTLGRLGKQKTL